MSQPPQAPPPPPPSGDGGQSPERAWDQSGGAAPSRPETNGLAVAALVCGILALLLSWIPLVNVLGLVLGMVAVGTGIGGMRRARDPRFSQKGLAVGGLVTGTIAILLALLILFGMAVVLNDPEFRQPLDRLMEGENPQDVLEDLERQLEEQN